eukprot:4080878-Pleurochrysis_carterae.AAC.2
MSGRSRESEWHEAHGKTERARRARIRERMATTTVRGATVGERASEKSDRGGRRGGGERRRRRTRGSAGQ